LVCAALPCSDFVTQFFFFNSIPFIHVSNFLSHLFSPPPCPPLDQLLAKPPAQAPLHPTLGPSPMCILFSSPPPLDFPTTQPLFWQGFLETPTSPWLTEWVFFTWSFLYGTLNGPRHFHLPWSFTQIFPFQSSTRVFWGQETFGQLVGPWKNLCPPFYSLF